MESIKKSIDDMSKLFSTKMEEFQKELDSSTSCVPGSSPISKLSTEFSTFKKFVIFAIQNLQAQVQTLSLSIDDMEMRGRRKMLLIHRLPEDENEDVSQVLHSLFMDNLGISNISSTSFSRCYRMGRFNENRCRPIVVKFKDITMRDNIWLAKSRLKGSGITISEFLTRGRHNTFALARQRHGVSKCWTKNGKIFVLGQDGSRHCVSCTADLDAIPGPVVSKTIPPNSSVTNSTKPVSGMAALRSKRNIKQK